MLCYAVLCYAVYMPHVYIMHIMLQVHEMFPQRVVGAGEKVFNLVAIGAKTGFLPAAKAVVANVLAA